LKRLTFLKYRFVNSNPEVDPVIDAYDKKYVKSTINICHIIRTSSGLGHSLGLRGKVSASVSKYAN